MVGINFPSLSKLRLTFKKKLRKKVTGIIKFNRKNGLNNGENYQLQNLQIFFFLNRSGSLKILDSV